MIPVVICGGFGTKLWPESRQQHPKQFLPLINGKSLFQINCESLLRKFAPGQIFVSTNQDQMSLAQTQVPGIPVDNYIIEPEMRNQGPATSLIAAMLFKKGFADEPFMLIQVDDLRQPEVKFFEVMDVCDKLARNQTKYITGGFRPDRIIAGVDYLVKGVKLLEESEINVYQIAQFLWRGEKETITSHFDKGSILVHSNHTCMTPRNFLGMLQKYRPDWYQPLMNILGGAHVATEYAKMPPGPIEEVTEKVYAQGEGLVVELPFAWVDIGTWESLEKYFRDNKLYETKNTLIDLDGQTNFVRVSDKSKIVALVGVDNLMVVDTGDALLVCARNHSGQVGEIVKEIKKRGLKAL